MNACRPGHQGFTLVELIVSLVLISIFVSIAGMGLVQIGQGYVFARQNVETIQKAQIAMTRMVKELGAATAVTSAGANSISYTRSGPVANTIGLSGTTVQITGTNPVFPASTLIDNATALAMTYWQADGVTAATTPADIRRVDISLTVTGANNQPLTFTNSITILESYW